jgi:hypothetical protein
MKKNYLLLTLATIVLGIQCNRDDLDTDVLRGRINSNWSAPFFKAFLNLKDIDEESEFLRKDANGALSVAFRSDTLVEHSPSEYFDIPEDQPITPAVAIVGAGPLGLEFEMATFGEARLSKVLFQSGSLNYSFPSDIPQNTMVRFTLNNADLNGAPAVFDFTVSASSSSGSFDISGLEINFLSGGKSVIGFSAEVILAPGLNTADPVQFEWNFSDLTIQQVEGYFGTRTMALPPTSQRIQLAGLNQFSGAINLTNPIIRVKVWNPLGVEFSFTPVMTTIKNGKPRFVNLPVVNINRAVAPGTGSEYSEIEFNSSNSDLSQLLSDLPEEIFVQGTIIVNPGADSTTVNFGSIENDVIFGLEIEIPLDFSAETLVLRQDLRNFTLLGSLPQEVTRIGVTVKSINSFPFDALLKVFFKDDNQEIVDSLVLPVIQAAPVNADGRVVDPIEYEYSAEFQEEVVKRLLDVTNAELELQLGTVNNGQDRVVIFEDYELEARLSVQAGVAIRILSDDDDE